MLICAPWSCLVEILGSHIAHQERPALLPTLALAPVGWTGSGIGGEEDQGGGGLLAKPREYDRW